MKKKSVASTLCIATSLWGGPASFCHAESNLVIATNSQSASTDASRLLALSLEDLGRITVTTPSGVATPIKKASGIASVITAQDIKAMGANDLMSVLESVPGVHVGRSEQADLRKPMIRGITSTFNPQTLVLVNSIPITSNFTGNRSAVLGNMPLRAVERIEVVRGPGSALYGADAYAGVINIITKTPDKMLGAEGATTMLAGASAGSLDTQEAWLQTVSRANELKTFLSIEYQTTDGQRETIDHDAQTNLDKVFGTHASLAPGPTNNSANDGLLRMEMSGNQWRFRTGYQFRNNVGTGAGIGFSLDPHGRFSGYRSNADWSYFIDNIADGLEIESRLSFLRTVQKVEDYLWLFPPGAFGGAFPDGFSGNPGFKEDQARYDLIGLYKGFDDQVLRLGVGIYWGDMYEVMLKRNFMILPNGRPAPRPAGMVDVSDTPEAYLPEVQRNNRYALVQDEWRLASDWQLTAGVRFDDYDDFGETTNPRFALVWDTLPTVTSKLLYGRAFRSPSFAELYTNSSVQVGNPELGPETIDTWEIAITVQPSPQFHYGLNLFRYSIEDFITAVPRADSSRLFFSNVGNRTGTGGEIEFSWRPTDYMKLLGNYSYAHAIDNATDKQVGEFPAHQIYARLEWLFAQNWKLTPQLNYIGEQQRVGADTRKPLSAYTTVDVTVRETLNHDTLEWAFSIFNLFDADAREPSPYANPIAIPEDFPMAGRTVMGEVSFHF